MTLRFDGACMGQKLAQNNSNPLKVLIRLALMHCFMTAFLSHQLTLKINSRLF